MPKFETQLIHPQNPERNPKGAINTPIYQSSTYEYEGKAEYDNIRYARLNNSPNHQALHHLLARLEGAESALVTSSGMAAISTSLLALLSQGDHLLIQDCVYGGTWGFVMQDLPRFGISYDVFDANNLDSLKAKCKSNTKAIYLETISNPIMRVGELAKIRDFARSKGITTLIDNTYGTPYNFKPAQFGIDISLHSCTKQLNGHSDLVAGAIIGRQELVQPISKMLNKLGGCLDPHACFLLERGLKTLGLRAKQQNETAQKLAQFLESHPAVERVNYPGLPKHSDYALAKEFLSGFGSMLSFKLKSGNRAAETFIEKVKLALHAPSSGGVETLVTLPAYTTHSFMSREDKEKIGIGEDLIRVSVGIEAAEDLIEDFKSALA